tara:strand:+ start:1415 stop:3643 length:2229 start_codon:yes stop_codon:yes gene_type:complete
MATIQQLLQSTKGGRVQTGDLADAPSLQPTIRSGGQYTVRTRQAPESKLSQLGRALSNINPALREYAAIQDASAEMFAREQMARDPQDVLYDLEKNEKEQDKRTREGKLPFLANMNAWKRNNQTLGMIAATPFRSFLLEKWDTADAEADPNEVAHYAMEEFRKRYPGLDKPSVNAGFQQAVNSFLPALMDQRNAVKNDQAKSQLKLNVAEGLRQLLLDRFDAVHQDSASVEGFEQKMEDLWKATNSLLPAEQLEIIEQVATSLAGDETLTDEHSNSAAEVWIQYATRLKVGSATAGSDVKATPNDAVFAKYGGFGGKIAALQTHIERIKEKREDDDNEEAEKLNYEMLAAYSKAAHLLGRNPSKAALNELARETFGKFTEGDVPNKFRAIAMPNLVSAAASFYIGEDQARLRLLNVTQSLPGFSATGVTAVVQKKIADDRDVNPTIGLQLLVEQKAKDAKDYLDVANKVVTGTYKLQIGEEVIEREDATEEQKRDDLLAWKMHNNETLGERYDTKRDEALGRLTLSAPPKLPTDASESLSWINKKTLSAQQGKTDSDIYLAEQLLREGKFDEAAEEAEDVAREWELGFASLNRMRWVDGGGVSINMMALDNWFQKVGGRLVATTAEKAEAKKKLIMYALASKALTPQTLKEGKIELRWWRFNGPFHGESLEIRNLNFKPSDLKGIEKFYPLIPKERLAELDAATGDVDVTDIEDMVKALLDVKSVDEETVKQFIINQATLYR